MQYKLMASIPEAEVAAVLATARRRVFARDEVVFHRDDPADTLHLIHKGRFAVRVTTPLGDSAMLAVLGPGDSFGELALVTDQQRSATVAALEPGETRAIHKLDFARLRRERPAIADVMIGVLGAQVDRLTEHLVEALYVPADRRLLRRLAELAEVYGVDGDGGQATVPLTQESLAEIAGTSRATVNKVLRQEERRGTVALARGRTIVRDREALARRGR
jgi:CRP-like cAMP-binding protein